MFKIILFFTFSIFQLFSQTEERSSSSSEKEGIESAGKVEIKPNSRDSEIGERLQLILEATNWFENPHVEVREGVVFLYGRTKREDIRKWASDLARSTADVSAVVNKIEMIPTSPWDFGPSFHEMEKQWRGFVRVVPSVLFALLILLLTWPVAKLSVSYGKKLISRKISSPLLQDLLAKCLGVFILLFALYLIFQVLGLTTIALTLLGGTGAVGIILGIAFRDITENLLASIFLSIHHPFRCGDLVEVAGFKGYVQRLNVRSTVLLSVDGDHIQIPNATIYKSNIRNFTANPNQRIDFAFSVKANNSLSAVQETFLRILKEHPAILDDPDPLVLLDDPSPLVLLEQIKQDLVSIHLYFWINGHEHSPAKVKSSVLKAIRIVLADPNPTKRKINPSLIESVEDLSCESEEIHEQAKLTRKLDSGDENLLES